MRTRALRPPIAKRAPLGLLDQLAISLGNIAILSINAHALTPSAFGQFVMFWTLCQLVLSVSRAIVGETLMARGAKLGDSPLLASLLVGLGIGAFLVLVSFLIHDLQAWALFAACAAPALALQDAVRFVCLEHGRLERMFVLDIANLTLLGAGSLLAFAGGSPHDSALAFAVAAWISALVGLTSSRRNPLSVSGGLHFLRRHFKHSSSYALEALMGASAGALTAVVLQRVAGYDALGAYKAAISVMGLTSVMINWARSVYMRQLRDRCAIEGSLKRESLKLSLILACTVLLTGAALLLLPDIVGTAVFADSWLLASALILAAVANRLFASLSVVPGIILRLLGESWRSTRVRFLGAVAALVLAPLGAVRGGGAGALLGEALAFALLTAGLYIQVSRSTRSTQVKEAAQ